MKKYWSVVVILGLVSTGMFLFLLSVSGPDVANGFTGGLWWGLMLMGIYGWMLTRKEP